MKLTSEAVYRREFRQNCEIAKVQHVKVNKERYWPKISATHSSRILR